MFNLLTAVLVEVLKLKRLSIDFSCQVLEDLQLNPEDNIPLFINVIVEALEVLGKVPEAVESLKCRIKREMALCIHRATDLVANRYNLVSVVLVANRDNLVSVVLLANRYNLIPIILFAIGIASFLSYFVANRYILVSVLSVANRYSLLLVTFFSY